MTQENIDFVKEMKNTMFARCNIEVPYNDMLYEFNNFLKLNTMDFVKFGTTAENVKNYNLDVLSLIDQTDNPQNAGNYIGGEKFINNTQATTLKKYFPKTLKWLAYNIPGIIRCKISRLAASNCVDFHYHPHRFPQLDAVLHIPLITNPGVRFYTRERNNKRTLKSCFFEPGYMWWFNAEDHVEHAVSNFGNQDRWHLWINTRVLDTKYNIMGRDTLYNALKTSEKF
jgi:hypothetical protein